MMDKEKINNLLQKSGTDDATKQQIKKFVENLSENDMKKLNAVLSDKQAAQDLLNSPQAQNLIKKFGNQK